MAAISNNRISMTDTATGNPNPKEKRKANPDRTETGFTEAHSKDTAEGADM